MILAKSSLFRSRTSQLRTVFAKTKDDQIEGGIITDAAAVATTGSTVPRAKAATTSNTPL